RSHGLSTSCLPYTSLFRSQATESIKDTIDCAAAMKEKGIVSTSLMDESTRSELLACIDDCGNGVSEMRLTLETVRLLKSKGDAVDRKSTRLNSSHVSISYA